MIMTGNIIFILKYSKKNFYRFARGKHRAHDAPDPAAAANTTTATTTTATATNTTSAEILPELGRQRIAAPRSAGTCDISSSSSIACRGRGREVVRKAGMRSNCACFVLQL